MESRSLGIAWKVVLAADVGVLAYGIMAVLRPEVLVPAFEAYTGRPWAALVASDPGTAAYLMLAGRVLGGLNVAFASVAIPVAAVPFRRGEPWAWYALLAGNTVGYGSPVAHDLIAGAVGPFEVAEIALIALVFAALALAARDVLGPRGRKG